VILIPLMLAACSAPTDEVELPPPATPESSVALVEPSYQLTPMPITPTWQPDDSGAVRLQGWAVERVLGRASR
jgi:hypothetical protein